MSVRRTAGQTDDPVRSGSRTPPPRPSAAAPRPGSGSAACDPPDSDDHWPAAPEAHGTPALS